jgi:hypothetical protein
MSELKIGMIGLDTSHCEAFVNLLHDSDNPNHVPGGRVVGAYPGGSQQASVSRDRVASFTKTLNEKHGIPIFSSIEDLAMGCDAFLLESVDGRQHLGQFQLLSNFGKPVFIDKPFACSYADARAIADLGKKKNIPVMSASAIRFAAGMAGLAPPGAKVMSCEVAGPINILPDYPAYFWYGVHCADVLYSYLGKGCVQVRVAHAEATDLLMGTWQGARMGCVRGVRTGPAKFNCAVFTDKGIIRSEAKDEPPAYGLMLKEIVKFFQAGKSPIDIEETVEVMAYLEAAGQSLEAGGKPVMLPR